MTYRVNVVIKRDRYGYNATCPELRGCRAQGDTLDEATANIKKAIEIHMETFGNIREAVEIQVEIFPE